MNLDFSKTEDLQNKIDIAVHALNFFDKWLEIEDCYKKNEDGGIIKTGKKVLMFDQCNPSSSSKGYANISNYLLSIMEPLQNDPVAKIENEFISNLTDYGVNSISNLTHIYKCKWKGHIPQSEIVYGSLHWKDSPHSQMTDKLSTIIRKAQDHNLLDYAEIDIILSDIEHIGKLLNRVASDLQKLFDKFQPQTQSIKNSSTASSYAIENKTDFIKIISAMYDCRMFKTIDGNIASNKKELIKTLGEFFNIEINDYSKLLSAAKNTNNYLDIFDKLTSKGEDYYKKQ